MELINQTYLRENGFEEYWENCFSKRFKSYLLLIQFIDNDIVYSKVNDKDECLEISQKEFLFLLEGQ